MTQPSDAPVPEQQPVRSGADQPVPPAEGTPREAGTSGQPDKPGKPGKPARSADADPLRGSRTSGVWAALVAIAVLLILLLIFIVQNTQDVQVAFLGWEGQAPLAVSLLAAAVTGMVIVIVTASLRMLQVRRRVRRERR